LNRRIFVQSVAIAAAANSELVADAALLVLHIRPASFYSVNGNNRTVAIEFEPGRKESEFSFKHLHNFAH